jgi:hypothetical protein
LEPKLVLRLLELVLALQLAVLKELVLVLQLAKLLEAQLEPMLVLL